MSNMMIRRPVDSTSQFNEINAKKIKSTFFEYSTFSGYNLRYYVSKMYSIVTCYVIQLSVVHNLFREDS